MSSIAYGWAPITKVEDQPDGTVIVHGGMSDAGLDRDRQRFSQDWLDEHVPKWFSESGNIREQHDGKKAAGAALVVKRDDATGRWDLAAHVVDPVAVLKVKTKTYKGFSIGVKEPHVTYGKADAPGGEIDGGYICETSLVDRPSNPRMLFTMVKSDDAGNPVEVAELVDHDDEADVGKAITHAPAGSPTGGQFMPGGTDSASGVDANRKGAEKVKVSPSGVSGGAKGGAGGKAAAGKQTSAGQLQAVMGAMQVLGIKTGDKQMSGPAAIKAVQAKLGMDQTGKADPATMAKIHELLAKHHADQAKAQHDQKQAAAKAVRDQKTADRAKAAEQRKAAQQQKQAAKQQAAAARQPAHRRTAHKGDAMDEPVMAMYDSDTADAADLVKAVSADQRAEYAKDGVAMASGDFPIPDVGHLRSAVGRLGNYGGDKTAARRHIISRARALNAVSALPDDWGVSKADEVLEQLDELGLWQGADGEVVKYDEADDIKGAQDAIACVARLIQSEAEELALGRMEEARDIEILLGAVNSLRYFLLREEQQAEMPDDRGEGGPAVEPDDDEMAGAVTMKTDNTAEPDATKVDKADLEKVDIPAVVKAAIEADLAKMDLPAIVKAAVAEVTTASEERLKSLEAQVTKALALPEPGGPVQIRTAPQQAQAQAHETQAVRAQVADLLQKADQIGNHDPNLAAGYRANAEKLERTLTG